MWTLGEIGDAQAVAPLTAALSDADPRVRGAAAQALGTLGDARAVAPLTAALGDSRIEVRSAAAQALGQIRHPQAVAALVAALAEHRFETRVVLWFARRKHWRLRQAAVAALGREEHAQVVEPLLAALSDTQPEVREAAAAALRQIETKVGRLRVDLDEQARLEDSLGRLAAVDQARWAQLNSARYGPMTPGDDTAVKALFIQPGQVVRFLVEQQPASKIRWVAKDEEIVVEYADPSSGRLQKRLVVLRQSQPAGYLCYLAWRLTQQPEE